MAKSRTELCEMLNEHAKRVCPKLKLSFKPYMGGQPRVVEAKVNLADIEELANSVVFNMTELNEIEGWELEKLFARRVSSMFVRIAREALNLEITPNPCPYLKAGQILH